MEAVTSSPLFGIVLSILAYAVGVWLNRKAKTPLVNPLLVAIIFRCSWAAPPAHLLLCSACMGYAGPLDWTKS